MGVTSVFGLVCDSVCVGEVVGDCRYVCLLQWEICCTRLYKCNKWKWLDNQIVSLNVG